MDIYEEMLLQIVDILKKHNRPIPDLTHKEAIEEIRSIILGNTTHAEKVTPDDIKKLDNTCSSDLRTCYNCRIAKPHTNYCPNCGARMER